MRLPLALLAAAGLAAEPFDTTRRVAWTGSRVAGSPEPPLPYRAVPAYPNLKVPCPIKVAREPGTDRMLLIHQAFPWGGKGRIVTFPDRPDAAEETTFLDLDGIAYGLAFHPDYTHNGYLYVGLNGPFSAKPKRTMVVRYTVDRKPPHAVVPGSAKTVIEWESDGHNGGDLDFGPDGMLYVTSGDGTSDSDTNLTGQDTTKLLAKVLRIDVDRPDPGKAYGVPKDNPFVGRAGYRPETYAYGFRNPWRLSVDRATGDVWVGNNGQDLYEQIYLVARGANYGWSVMEGSHEFYRGRKAGPDPFSKPIVEHHHSEARSMTGGLVYRGTALPGLAGAYVYGDFSTGRLWGVRHDKGRVTWHRELVRSTMQVTGFGTDGKGELLVCDHGGGLFRLEPNPPDPAAKPFPTKLSETGLFASVKDHAVAPGVIPYSVNAPLWSDGAEKERFVALPGDATVEFTRSNGWNFPDGAVTVKTFALDTPAGKRRVETRIMTRQLGQWAGYSYVWNDEQTEATLAPAGGLDRAFAVRDGAGGVREQVWRVPGRAECMVCHSRAANYSLGLCELQMNRDHDYGGGVVANQLEVLARLGVLRFGKGERAAGAKEQAAAARPLGWAAALVPVPPGPLGLPGLLARVLEKPEAEKLWPERTPRLPRPAGEYRRLADPRDPSADLDARARSYLHANCASCHVDAGGGNAQFNADYLKPPAERKLVGAVPQHHTFDIPGAKLIDPGRPERSVLLARVGRRGPNQMPPLASNVVDAEAVRLLKAWVAAMPAEQKPAAGR